jgi:hypothetical protein
MDLLQAAEIMKFMPKQLGDHHRRIRDDSRSMARGGEVVAAVIFSS